MRRMYRYEVPMGGAPTTISMPARAKVAMAAWSPRPDKLCDVIEFWAEFDEAAYMVSRVFQVFGTGWELPENAAWVRTCPRTPAGYVWHLYELR